MKKIVVITIILCTICTLCFSQNSYFPLTIDKMFSLADSNNLRIKTSESAYSVSQEQVKIAKNEWLPNISISLAFGYNGDGVIMDRNFANPFTVDIPGFSNNFAVEVSQLIYSGGVVKNKVKIAELQSQISAFDIQNNQQQIRFLLLGNYLEMCKLQNQIAVFDMHIAQTEKMLSDMKSRYAEGTALQNDITRYELKIQELQYNKIQLINSCKIINNQLVTYLGLSSNTQIVPDTTSFGLGYELVASVDDNSKAFRSSPQFKQAELLVRVSEHNEKLAHAARYPHIGFFAANQFDGPVVIDIPALNKNFDYWYVGVGLHYQLDNLYKSGKNIRAGRMALQHANQLLALKEEEMQLATYNAYTHYQEAFELLNTKQKSMQLAQQNYDVISYRYTNDLALLTDLLDASSQNLNAELQVVNARINIVFNYYKIKYIAGTL